MNSPRQGLPLAPLAVLAALGFAAAAAAPAAARPPARAAPPARLAPPAAHPRPARMAAGPSATVSAGALRSRLAAAMGSVGPASGADVIDLDTGRRLFSLRPDTQRSPASVQKLLTSSTALLRFGPEATLDTAVLGTGRADPADVWRGNLYLRGAGDPTFGSGTFVHRHYGSGATVQRLALNLLDATGIQSVHGEILGDASVFDNRRGGPSAGFGLDSNLAGSLSGLAFDRGTAGGSAAQGGPAAFAARQLAGALRTRQVPVTGASKAGQTPSSAVELAHVSSPPMRTLVRLTDQPSDNFFAETLLKDLGARFGTQGSTAAGAAVVRRQMRQFGLRPRVVDGSGLARADHVSPRDIVTLLAHLRSGAVGTALTESLPLAGHSGTLAHRMRGTAADGRCRAKTGTLIGVSALAGYCDARNGDRLAFALLMNGVSVDTARIAQDHIAATLAAYSG